jgi:hypothetical protein
MEALVALGVAGNVVQFVQFAGQLISELNEIRKEGSPKSLRTLHQISKNVTKQAEVIEARLKAQIHTLSSQEDQVGRKTASE